MANENVQTEISESELDNRIVKENKLLELKLLGAISKAIDLNEDPSVIFSHLVQLYKSRPSLKVFKVDSIGSTFGGFVSFVSED